MSMRQQVNLYLPEFRPRRHWCTASQVAAVWLIALLLAGGVIWDQRQEVERLQARQEQLDARRQALLARVEEARRKFPPRQQSPQLVSRVGELERELRNKQRVLEMLEDGGIGATGGFSSHLAALAREIVEGVWITALELRGGGTGLRVRGSTVQPRLVPLYIERLGREEIFHGTPLEQVQLERPEQDPLRIDFEFYTPGLGGGHG